MAIWGQYLPAIRMIFRSIGLQNILKRNPHKYMKMVIDFIPQTAHLFEKADQNQ